MHCRGLTCYFWANFPSKTVNGGIEPDWEHDVGVASGTGADRTWVSWVSSSRVCFVVRLSRAGRMVELAFRFLGLVRADERRTVWVERSSCGAMEQRHLYAGLDSQEFVPA